MAILTQDGYYMHRKINRLRLPAVQVRHNGHRLKISLNNFGHDSEKAYWLNATGFFRYKPD